MENYDRDKDFLLSKFSRSKLGDEDLKEKMLQSISQDFGEKYSTKGKISLMKRVFSELRGFGYIDRYLDDDEVSEIMVNSNRSIYIEKRGKLLKIRDKYKDEASVENIIQRMVGKSGREINRSNPIVDANLEDGSRINAILPPLSTIGPILTIRKFPKEDLSLEDLVKKGSFSEEVKVFLEKITKEKYNILISGGTGSGKTTLLNAMVNRIKGERIVTIEDSRELKLSNIDNLINLEARNANIAGVGRVEIKDLLRASLRIRPDRIVVGEVRGKEALDMLQAMNTGHPGSFSTIHSNSPSDCISRLETMILQEDRIPLEAIKRQIKSSLDLIIQLSRLGKERKVVEIAEIIKDVNWDIIDFSILYKYDGRKLNKVADMKNTNI